MNKYNKIEYFFADVATNEDDGEDDIADKDLIIVGTNLEIPDEEQESWYHLS